MLLIQHRYFCFNQRFGHIYDYNNNAINAQLYTFLHSFNSFSFNVWTIGTIEKKDDIIQKYLCSLLNLQYGPIMGNQKQYRRNFNQSQNFFWFSCSFENDKIPGPYIDFNFSNYLWMKLCHFQMVEMRINSSHNPDQSQNPRFSTLF